MQHLSAIPRLFALLLLVAILTACGGGTTSTTDMVGTMVASTYQALTAAAPQVPQATATLEPPPSIPTQTPAPAIRLNFTAGSTYGAAGINLQPGQSQSYVVGAMQGQPLVVLVESPDSDGVLSIRGADNTELLSAGQGYNAWWGTLPSTQDYIITVTAGASGGAYDLGVTIAARISFAPGATSATVSGTTVEGHNVSYVVWAAAGQTMTVNLNAAPGAARIEVWGVSDGQIYVNRDENWTSFYITLPAGQDFIIDVYPNNGQVVNYTLAVDIH